jgi:O-antigen ligase
MRMIRLAICGLLGFAVLSFGAVEAWGQAVLEIGAAILFVLWGVEIARRGKLEIRGNWIYLPLLGLGVVALAQLVFGVSIYPYFTKLELLKWAAYILLFFLTTESFRTEEQLKELVWFLLVLGFVVSLFAIVQHFTFNGKLYWLVPLPAGGAPFGPFVNSNHFAGFVELVMPLGLGLLLFRARRPEQVPTLVLFTIVPVGALVVSGSRGGIVALAMEIALLAILSRTQQVASKGILAAAGIALLAGAFALWLGVSTAVEHFEKLAHGGIEQELRVSIYKDTWRIFLDHPWMGTGLGTLITAYPKYASFYDGRIVDHAHNDYLELLADAGVIGGLCGLAFIVLLLWRGLQCLRAARGRSERAMRAGALVACAGLLVHSLVDFNLHIPSNALVFLLLACVATMERAEPGEKMVRLGRARRDGTMETIANAGRQPRQREAERVVPELVSWRATD